MGDWEDFGARGTNARKNRSLLEGGHLLGCIKTPIIA